MSERDRQRGREREGKIHVCSYRVRKVRTPGSLKRKQQWINLKEHTGCLLPQSIPELLH